MPEKQQTKENTLDTKAFAFVHFTKEEITALLETDQGKALLETKAGFEFLWKNFEDQMMLLGDKKTPHLKRFHDGNHHLDGLD